MHHDGKLALFEDGAQRGTIFHLQFAGAAAHEEFDASHESRIHLFQASSIGGSGTEEESKINQTLLLSDFNLLEQTFFGHRGRYGVGHVNDGGDPTRGCGTTFGVEVALSGETRIAEVDVLIDHSRK